MRRATNKFTFSLVLLLVGVLFVSVGAQAQKIVHWQHHSPAYDIYIEERAAEFEALHGVEVEIVVTPLADFYTKLLPALAAGSGPDVMQIRATDVPRYSQYGVLQPLQVDHEAYADVFIEGAIGHLIDEDGVFYGFPTNGQTVVLFYNTRLFEEAGIDAPPATWDELIEVAQELTIYDEWDMMEQSGLAHGDYTPVLLSFMSQAHEGEWLDENGKALFNTPEVLDAFTWLTKWHLDFGVESYDFTSRWTAFRQEELAMVMAHPAMLGSFRSTHPDLPIGIAEIPARNAGEPQRSVQGNWSLSVSSQASDPAMASKWVEFLSSEEQNKKRTAELGELPAVYSLLDDAELLADEPLLASPLASVGTAVPYPFEAMAQMESAVTEAYQRVTIGGETPEQALNWLANEAEKVYREVILGDEL